MCYITIWPFYILFRPFWSTSRSYRHQNPWLLWLSACWGVGSQEVLSGKRRGKTGLLLPGDRIHCCGGCLCCQNNCDPIRVLNECLCWRPGPVSNRDQVVRHPRGEKHDLQVERQASVCSSQNREGDHSRAERKPLGAPGPPAWHRPRHQPHLGHRHWCLHSSRLCPNRKRRWLRRVLLPLPRVTLWCFRKDQKRTCASQLGGALLWVSWWGYCTCWISNKYRHFLCMHLMCLAKSNY